MRSRWFAVILLAGCAPAYAPELDEPVMQQVGGAQCDATFFEGLKGEPIEVVRRLNTPLRVRILGPDEFVTRDFDPDRLTFTEAPDGTVSRVFCG